MKSLQLISLAILATAAGIAGTLAAGMPADFAGKRTSDTPGIATAHPMVASATLRKRKQAKPVKPRRTVKRRQRNKLTSRPTGTAATSGVRMEQLNNKYPENMH